MRSTSGDQGFFLHVEIRFIPVEFKENDNQKIVKSHLHSLLTFLRHVVHIHRVFEAH